MIVCTKCLTTNADDQEFCQNASCGSYLPYWGTTEAATPSGATPADAAGRAGVKVVLADDVLRTSPGTDALCEARVCNTGTVAGDFLLHVFGEPSQWSVVEPARVRLEPGEEVTATARVRPPASVMAATRRIALGFGATSVESPGVFAVKERVLELVPAATGAPSSPTAGITVAVSPVEVTCDAGGTATVQASVRNTGTVIDELVVDVLGARDWASAEPARLPLAPGQAATATITFHPPRASTPAAGAVAAAIKVTSTTNPAVSVQEPVHVAIRPFSELQLVLRPERAEARRAASFELWVMNCGNAGVDGLAIAGTDPEDQLRFVPSPPTCTVPAGEWSRSVVTASPRKRILLGRSKPRPFELAVTGGDEARRATGGTLVQKPLIAWWMLAIAALVVAVIPMLADFSDLSLGAIVLLLVVLLVVLAVGGALLAGSLGRFVRPGPDPLTLAQTLIVGAGGLVAGLIVAFLAAKLFGDVGAMLAIPAAIGTAALLVGAVGRGESSPPPPVPRPPDQPGR